MKSVRDMEREAERLASLPPRDRAIEDILLERHRQEVVHGWTPEHDDGHVNGEIAAAAADYASPGQHPVSWSWAGGKAEKSRRQQLVIAAALTLAEIERLDRLASGKHGTTPADDTQRTNPNLPSDGWEGIETAPKDGRPFKVLNESVIRWLAYKPEGARQMGKPGRWQVHNGYGWENCGEPTSKVWKDVERPLPNPPLIQGEEK